jgi:DNA polymerase-3 subunit beta
MHAKVSRAHFLKALAHQQNVVERKTTVPILSHVLLEFSLDKTVKITGTDLELTVVETLEADVKKEGFVTLSAHLLYDIIRKLPEESEITLEEASGHVFIRSSFSTFKLPTLAVSDFPPVTQHKPTHTFTLTGLELRRLVDQTRFAISTEEARSYLNGIYLHADSDNLKVVATDAHRLALSWISLPSGAKNMEGIILSRKSVNEIRKLSDTDTDFKISISQAQAAFQVGSVTLYSRLVQGQFPDYHPAIPKGNNCIVTLDTRTFESAVDRVSMVSQYDKVRTIKLQFDAGRLILSAQATDSGFGQEEMPVEYVGDPLEIGFNARYILDVVQQIKGKQMQFCFGNAVNPALIKDQEDDHVLYVLMPMRV